MIIDDKDFSSYAKDDTSYAIENAIQEIIEELENASKPYCLVTVCSYSKYFASKFLLYTEFIAIVLK